MDCILYVLHLTVSFLTFCVISFSTTRIEAQEFFQFELMPQTEEQWSLLRSLENKNNSYIFLSDLQSKSRIQILVSPEVLSNFYDNINHLGIRYETLDKNFHDDDDQQEHHRAGTAYNWCRYHTLDETYDWLRSLSKLYPENAYTFVAGKSYEGRDLLGIKITYGMEDRSKRAIFLEGGMHAREWISPATTTFIANQLLTSPQKDVRSIAENFDWYILPHTNPDGYIYTHTTDRLWRKTRSRQANGCFGVDINRNWDLNWNGTGSSNNPCDETYAGPKAFSEIETRSLAELLIKLKGKLFMYIAYHANRQMLLYPYAYTSELPANIKDLKRVFNAAIVGLNRLYGSKYSGGNIYDKMYPASGVGIDWIYEIAGVPYSFFYELCPLRTRVFGFKLPDEWIIPTGEEALVSLVEMVTEAAYGGSNVTNINAKSGQNSKIECKALQVFLFIIFILLLIGI